MAILLLKSNLKNLEEKIRILEAGELNVSGPVIGMMGDATTVSYTHLTLPTKA